MTTPSPKLHLYRLDGTLFTTGRDPGLDFAASLVTAEAHNLTCEQAVTLAAHLLRGIVGHSNPARRAAMVAALGVAIAESDPR